MPSILFVCTANRFRSPLAEAIFQAELTKRGLQTDWQVGSAGTWTKDGLPAMPEAISAARELGLDLTFHRSRPVSAELLRQCDLVFVMESGQKEALIIEFSAIIENVFLLTEGVGGVAYDIPDPFFTDESPVSIAKELIGLFHNGFEKIVQLAERCSK
jgi:protein-tyrosine phosphatase